MTERGLLSAREDNHLKDNSMKMKQNDSKIDAKDEAEAAFAQKQMELADANLKIEEEKSAA